MSSSFTILHKLIIGSLRLLHASSLLFSHNAIQNQLIHAILTSGNCVYNLITRTFNDILKTKTSLNFTGSNQHQFVH